MASRLAVLALLIAAATSEVLAQTPSPPAFGPTFDVVSIKRNTSGISSGFTDRPDGGFTMTNVPVRTLIFRAYPSGTLADIIELPGWAAAERFDVSATASLTQPTAADRIAMMQAMLVDRFRLVAHIEKREQQVYDLVLLRRDGRLGPGLKKYEEDVDCVARLAAERAAARVGGPPSRPDFNASPPPCAIYSRGSQGNEMEGKITMAGFAQFISGSAGRPVLDKTGLTGIYHIMAEYDRLAAIRGPATTDTLASAPSVFTAVQEQLGLKLEPSSAMRDMLIIDRIERPTDN
jgi:uncharacterized protein (TIGR03435 family)